MQIRGDASLPEGNKEGNNFIDPCWEIKATQQYINKKDINI